MAARKSPQDPDGSASASTNRVAKARKATLRTTKASAGPRPPDLDARNQNMAGTRKPAGPPLEDGPRPSAAVRRAAGRTTAAPTDPKRAAPAAKTSTTKKATTKKSTATKKKATTKKSTATKKKATTKKSTARRRGG